MFFKDVVGQEEAKKMLIREALSEKIAHAKLICGGEGIGKLPLAIAYARYISCENPKGDDACGICPNCIKYNKLAHPDLHFIFPVIKKKNNKDTISDDFIHEWRNLLTNTPYFNLSIWLKEMYAENQQAQIYVKESDEINRKLSLKSSQGGYKIVIIWLPEKMNEQCANKLLKLIEEPSEDSLFILVSDNAKAILPTIYSRTQRIELKRLSINDVASYIQSKYGLSEQDAISIAATADGNVAQAEKNLAFDSENKEFFKDFVQLMRLAYSRDLKQLKVWSENVFNYKREKIRRFLKYASRSSW